MLLLFKLCMRRPNRRSNMIAINEVRDQEGYAKEYAQLLRKNPRALAGSLRRAQTFLRTLGIEITFSREGRMGTRIIRVRTSAENTVSTVSIVSAAHTRSRADLAGVRE